MGQEGFDWILKVPESSSEESRLFHGCSKAVMVFLAKGWHDDSNLIKTSSMTMK